MHYYLVSIVAVLLLVCTILYFYALPAILSGLFNLIYFFFFTQFVRNPILLTTYCSLGGLSIFNVILLILLFITMTYLNYKLLKILKVKFILIFNWINFTISYLITLYLTKDRCGGSPKVLKSQATFILGLGVSSVPNNSSGLYCSNATRSLESEWNLLSIVISKLDKEQPLSSGVSRYSAFQIYEQTLREKAYYFHRLAWKHEYKKVIMREPRFTANDTDFSSSSSGSDFSSSVSSVSSSLYNLAF